MQELKDGLTGLRQTSGRMSHWLLGWSGVQTTRLTSRAGRGLGWAGCWDFVSGNRSLAFDPVPSRTEFLLDSSRFTLISYPSCYSGHQWSHLDVIFSSPPPAHPLQASRLCLPHSQTSPTNPLPLSSVHPGRRFCGRFSVAASSAAPASTYPWKPTRLLNSNLDQAISRNVLGASPCPRVETQLLTGFAFLRLVLLFVSPPAPLGTGTAQARLTSAGKTPPRLLVYLTPYHSGLHPVLPGLSPLTKAVPPSTLLRLLLAWIIAFSSCQL